MGRLLREEDVIKKIEWWFGILKQNPDILIDAIKTTHAVNEWIPCATGLMPENGQKVWISTVKHNVEPALYIPEIMRNDYVWECGFSYLRKDEVLAWMPYTMPEPYMEDNDGNIE